MKKGRSLARDFWRYGALALLLQPVIACTPATPDDADRPSVESGNAISAAQPAAAPTAEAADKRLVVAFGDSLFAGYGLAPDEGLAPALERALAERGLAARVFNAGVSGDTTAGGRQRLAFTLDGLERKPDLVIVGLGGNDMLRGLDPAATRANLDAILAELKQRGIPAMVTGMIAAPNMGEDYGARFNAIYPDLAAKYGVPLHPFLLDRVIGRRTLMLPDQIHPNAQGVTTIAGAIAPMVAEALPDAD